MRKFRPPLNDAEKKELQRLAALDFTKWNETEVREEYIRPILTRLGYRRDQDYAVGAERSFSLHPSLRVGRSRIRLDYITDVRKQYFWLIEAKDGNPAHKDGLAEEDVAQAYFYSLHPEVNCRYFAVSNGWLFNLYDRDALDERYTPLLSIRHTELPERFLLLDQYLGSTQIVPMVKQRLLDQIRHVLAAEVALERLDEFQERVRAITFEVRPQVLQNFRANASKEKEARKLEREADLEHREALELVESEFSTTSAFGEIVELGHALVEKLHRTAGNMAQLRFFDRILLGELRPVRYWYYINCVNFLLMLHRSGVTEVKCQHKGRSGSTARDLLHDYLRWIFTRFEARPDLRLLTAAEGAAQTVFSRIAVLAPTARETAMQASEVWRYILPEERLAWLGPTPAGALGKLVDDAVLQLLGQFLHRNYDRPTRTLRLGLAKQEIIGLLTVAARIEHSAETQYKDVTEDLMETWGMLSLQESLFTRWDPIIAGTLELIGGYDGLMQELPTDILRQIEHVVSIGAAGSTERFEARHGIVRREYSPQQREAHLKSFFSLEYKSSVSTDSSSKSPG